jgi:glycosyltransferase involved in cell wall biosynthesis
MSAGPKISLVTPTYNQAATLRQTIESVLRQDYENLEYRIFDAGSRDGTVEIMREYDNDSRFHWTSGPDKGQSDAINRGLARCTGEIFNWINSDDYLEPGALRIVAESFQRHGGIDLVSGKTAEFRGDPPHIFNTIELPLRASPEATITVGIFCQPSTFWRTQIIREIGGIDEKLHYVMDWDLWVRYLARFGQKRVRRIEQLLAHYRHHPQAKTSAGSEKFYEEAGAIFRRLLLAQNAPPNFLRLENFAPAVAPATTYTFGPHFGRARFLGAYAERMVRIQRKKNPTLARKWLRAAFGQKPWVTFWRLKMALRLLFR